MCLKYGVENLSIWYIQQKTTRLVSTIQNNIDARSKQKECLLRTPQNQSSKCHFARLLQNVSAVGRRITFSVSLVPAAICVTGGLFDS